MILPRHVSLPITALGVLAAIALTGCSPEPEPRPTPTAAFASEEAAFAAAEETYRAYNDAGNADRAGDSSQDPQDFLMGSALEGFLDGREYLRTNGLALQGETKVARFEAENATMHAGSTEVTAVVCLDVAGTSVIDVSGQDVTPETRPDTVAQRVSLISYAATFRISQESEADATSC